MNLNKNKIVGLSLVLTSVMVFSIFLLWIIILPAIGVTETVSSNITSGYWGIAIFTMIEVVVIAIMLFWVGKTPLKNKDIKDDKA